MTGVRWRGEKPSGLYSFRQVAEFKLGQVRPNSEWVTSEALPHNSVTRNPSNPTLSKLKNKIEAALWCPERFFEFLLNI